MVLPANLHTIRCLGRSHLQSDKAQDRMQISRWPIYAVIYLSATEV